MSSGFISESDLAEKRKVQKEIWQSTRGENDPDDPPEAAECVHDPRNLYDRLQEQRNKKQEEWDEAHKLKNMVRGLEDDEVDFLELVDNTKLREERRIRQEEITALKEYRKKVSERHQKIVQSDTLAELKSDSTNRKSSARTNQGKKSQLMSIAGSIKRKNSESDDSSTAKNIKVSDSAVSSSPDKPVNKRETVKTLHCVAVLPGLGIYTDSSDSENESNSDDELFHPNVPRGMTTDITGRIVSHPHC